MDSRETPYPPSPLPITTQPIGTGFEVRGHESHPDQIAGLELPGGLELLYGLDQLIIHQKPELVEVSEFEHTQNRYTILDATGKKIFFATETTEDTCCGGGTQRPFEITIVDLHRSIVLRLSRPCSPALVCSSSYQCCCCWLGRLGGKLVVELPDRTVLGEIVHTFGCCYIPYYNVYNSAGKRVLKIRGEACSDCCCCTSDTFQISSADTGDEVGRIARNYQSQRISLLVSDADTFTVQLEVTMDVKLKGLIMAAVFLLDFMYFETATKSNNKAQTKNIRPRVFPALTK